MRISDWSSDVCSSVLIEHQRSLATSPCAGYNLGVQTRLRANNMSQNHCGNQAGFTVLASNRKNAPTRALRVIVDFPNESLLKLLKIGSAHVCTPVTNAHLVCRHPLDNTKQTPT